MIAAAWAAAVAMTVLYAGLLSLAGSDPARRIALPYLAVTVAAWAFLAHHHNRRHR